MKKSNKVKANKGRVRQEQRGTGKTAPKKNAASTTGMVPADIRKAYKSRLISAYFNRSR